jgi:hypothetical protein
MFDFDEEALALNLSQYNPIYVRSILILSSHQLVRLL